MESDWRDTAGVNPRHTHPCAHGMFVLEGTLVTHSGSYVSTFVWFPEGTAMEHGDAKEHHRGVYYEQAVRDPLQVRGQ
jgi:hypothetical protein